MPRGRPVPELRLTAEERETLQGWARRPKTVQALALRARIILACVEGASNTEVSTTLRRCPRTVGKWRSRFAAKRLEGLLDEPRPGAPRQISDPHECHALEPPPHGPAVRDEPECGQSRVESVCFAAPSQ